MLNVYHQVPEWAIARNRDTVSAQSPTNSLPLVIIPEIQSRKFQPAIYSSLDVRNGSSYKLHFFCKRSPLGIGTVHSINGNNRI